MKKRKILIVSQYFWPESFGINDLSLGLQERGYTLTILTGKPNYPKGKYYTGYSFFAKKVEYWNGIRVLRSPMFTRGKGGGVRIFLNYFSFAFFASFKALFLKEKFDIIFVYEPSPVTVGIPAMIVKLRSKARIIFWVQDLWPESISAAGGIKNRIVLVLLDSLTRFIYRSCHKILVQSKRFIPYILNQGVPKDKLIYYPNSTSNFYGVEQREETYLGKLPSGFNILFAGNIGEAQSFDTLINAALILKNDSIEVNWVILGEGRMKEYVISRVKSLKLDDRFFFLGSFPSSEMPKYFSCSDALIVSLKKDTIFSLTIPSKLQSYLACGKPIIGSLNGEGAFIIEEAKAGFTSPAENDELLADAIIKLYKLSEGERIEIGRNARTFFEKEFERETLLDKLELILS